MWFVGVAVVDGFVYLQVDNSVMLNFKVMQDHASPSNKGNSI